MGKSRVVLSIKPEFVERILDGTKRFEFRRTIFKEPVRSVVVYSTMPVGQVVADFDVKQIHQLPVHDLWTMTKDYAGISEERFLDYFKGKEFGYAIEIRTVNRYQEPLSLSLDFGVGPPQAFVYVEG